MVVLKDEVRRRLETRTSVAPLIRSISEFDRLTPEFHLGHCLSDQTVGNILRRHGMAPAPKRSQTTSWKDFIAAHRNVLAGADFFTVEVIWIDKENFRVLRIELSAQNLPRMFPLDTVESAVDYDYVLIGEGKYLLPVHSEALSCAHGTSGCTRNVIEFRNYKKFTSDSNVTFDPEK